MSYVYVCEKCHKYFTDLYIEGTACVYESDSWSWYCPGCAVLESNVKGWVSPVNSYECALCHKMRYSDPTFPEGTVTVFEKGNWYWYCPECYHPVSIGPSSFIEQAFALSKEDQHALYKALYSWGHRIY